MGNLSACMSVHHVFALLAEPEENGIPEIGVFV